MKGVCFQGIERVDWQEVEDPRLESAGDAIVEVSLAGLCGSDLHVYHGREAGLDRGTVMGHEFVGRVVEVGPEVRTVRVGDRVCAPFSTSCGECFFCRSGLTSRCGRGALFGWRQEGRGLHGGQATHVRVPLADGTLVPIDDSISDRQAILLGDNLATGFFCADLAGAGTGVEETAVVVGCGAVGLAAAIAARFRGVGQLFAVDPVDDRRGAAARLGAVPLGVEESIEFIRQATGGRGADAVLECVGLPAAQRLAFDLLRPGGRLAVAGCHSSASFAFSPVDAYDKNLTYRTGRCPARAYIDLLRPLLPGTLGQAESLITHTFAMDDCRQAYELFSGRRGQCIKAVLIPPR